MNRLTREQVLASAASVELVELPALGGTVGVRTMTVSERDLFDRKVVETPSDQGVLRAELLLRCLVGEDGARLFGDGDLESLKALPAVALEPAFGIALRLNALRAEDLEALGKASAAIPAGGSSSFSPTSSG